MNPALASETLVGHTMTAMLKSSKRWSAKPVLPGASPGAVSNFADPPRVETVLEDVGWRSQPAGVAQ